MPETSFADVNLLQSLVSMSRSKRPVGPVRESVAKPDPALPRAIRIGGSVETAWLVHRVEPPFRPMAPPDEDPTANRASRAATLLGRTPQDAVRRWVYQPTLLGGEPVELITSIHIVFRPIPD